MTAEVALGQVGIVFDLEVSRLARDNTDWYRLFDLCGITDTLIGDSDGVYHPALFNFRLVLGLKGTTSEAELHILRVRLDGGIRNKAVRGDIMVWRFRELVPALFFTTFLWFTGCHLEIITTCMLVVRSQPRSCIAVRRSEATR